MYPILVIINLLGTILTYPLAPILALCHTNKDGWCDNATVWKSGPRLWSFLSWFQTPDNSLDGDRTFVSLHAPSYKSKVQWLWRNPFYGFAVKYFDGSTGMSYAGDINCDATHPGTIRVKGHGLWQYNSYHKLFGKMVCLNFGHNIRALVEPGFITPDQWHSNEALIKNYPATFAFTIRLV